MNKKHIALLWVFILYGSVAVAQKKPCNFVLDITVIQNNIKLNHAEIFIEKDHRIEFTNENGHALIPNLCDSIVDLEIQTPTVHEHYQLNISQNIPQEISINTIDTNNILISVQKTPILRQDYFNVESKSIQSFSGQLQNLPQVQLLTTGRTISKPMIQGMTGLRVPIFIDGMRLQGQSWGQDHSPELGATGTEHIVILYGVDALILGSDVWGNTIAVENKHQFKSHEVDFHQNLSYQSNGGVFNANGILQFGQRPSKEIKGKANGTYLKYLSQMSKDYATPLGILANTASREYMFGGGQTLQFKASELNLHASFYNFTSGIYLGSHIGNLTDLKQAINSDTPNRLVSNGSYEISKPYQTTQQIHGILEWIQHRVDQLKINLNFQQNLRQEYDPHRNSNIQFPQLDILQQTLGFNASKNFTINQLNFTTGLQIQYQKQQFGGYYFVPEYSGLQESFYTKLNLPSLLNNRFTHASIVRVDIMQRSVNHWYTGSQTQFKENFEGFSGGYSFEWNSQKHEQFETQLRADILQLWRAPGLNERFSKGVHHGSASFELGNVQLKPENGQKLNFTAQIQRKNPDKNGVFCKLNFSGFSQYSQNFIHLFPMSSPVLTVRGAFPGFEYKQLPTIYSGAELEVEMSKQFVPLNQIKMEIQWTSKASVMHAKINNSGSYPPLIPCSFVANQISISMNQWKLNLSHKYQFKQAFYTANTDITGPPEDFNLIGIQLEFPKFGKSKSFKISMNVDNLTNTNYRDYLDRFRYFTPMPGRNIGVKFSYQIHHHKDHID